MPFHPAGAKAWVEVCKLEGRHAAVVTHPRTGMVPSKRGAGEKFHFWLYREYGGAEVVMQNKKPMIRFVDEQYQMLFSLRWM
jgi:hypothetical protein